MAAAVKVRWTPLAVEHLASARAYLAGRNPRAANTTIERILRAVQLLGQHPRLGRPGRVEGARETVVGGTPFLVAYRLHDDQIHVLSVLHAAQRWPDRF